MTYLSYLYYYNSPAGPYSVIGIIEGIGWSIPASILFGVSAAALVIGTRRSADPVLKTSLKWLGFALIFYVLAFVINPLVGLVFPNLTLFEFFYSYYTLPSGAVGIVSAYCLYRSARSLAPIGRISLEP